MTPSDTADDLRRGSGQALRLRPVTSAQSMIGACLSLCTVFVRIGVPNDKHAPIMMATNAGRPHFSCCQATYCHASYDQVSRNIRSPGLHPSVMDQDLPCMGV